MIVRVSTVKTNMGQNIEARWHETAEKQPRYAGRINLALAVTLAEAWPKSLEEEVDAVGERRVAPARR